MMTIRISAFAAALSLMLFAGQLAAEDGYFTAGQAEQGHTLYNNMCAQCHRPDLTGAMGPALTGPAFLERFGNQPISNLYGYEHANMPATNPGSVPADQLWPITAYILSKNGLPAGAMPLGPDTASRVLGK